MPDVIWAWALGDRGFYLYSGSSAFHECEITATDFSSLGKECLWISRLGDILPDSTGIILALYDPVDESRGGARMKLTKIIAPTDLSKLSRAGVRYALEMALGQGAEVVVYHVISEHSDWFDKDDALNPARALLPQQKVRLEEFVKESFAEFFGKVKIREVVEVGVPYKEIVRLAEDEDADLIVMSTHGRTGFEQVVLGSVAAKVVARAPCPVLSIRPPK
jgi:universal stress protein A